MKKIMEELVKIRELLEILAEKKIDEIILADMEKNCMPEEEYADYEFTDADIQRMADDDELDEFRHQQDVGL